MNRMKNRAWLLAIFMSVWMLTGCSSSKNNEESTGLNSHDKQEQVQAKKSLVTKEAEQKRLAEEQEKKAAEQKRLAEEQEKKAAEQKRLAEEQEKKEEQERIAAEAKAKEAEEQRKIEEKNAQIVLNRQNNYTELANMEYAGIQTIDINGGVPYFTGEELSLQNGAWESYGDLDGLNRVTVANAMLNQSLMPTGERGDISRIQPTGWKNKKIKSGYLYNRSHLIGWALAGENANPKNLMTGTRQLNSPEMLRFEMDVKYYLEQSPDHYVRYRITPIFRGDELLARGVQMEAQSINSNAIQFNVYIFNVQDGVTLNYADGSSVISGEQRSEAEVAQEQLQNEQQNNQNNQTNPVATGQYVDANGNGLIKGSKNGIYHVPGSTYYDRTTNPAAWFKSVSEAEAAGYRAPK